MVCRSYWCDVDDGRVPQTLDNYERELGLTPEWTPIDEAVRACRRADAQDDRLPWVARERAVVEWLSRQDPFR